MVDKNIYNCQKYNLDIRLRCFEKYIRTLIFRKIWRAYLEWYTSALGMEYLNSIVRLSHGRPVLYAWARLFVLVGSGCPGGLPDVLRLHVPHVRVAREHAHFSLTLLA